MFYRLIKEAVNSPIFEGKVQMFCIPIYRLLIKLSVVHNDWNGNICELQQPPKYIDFLILCTTASNLKFKICSNFGFKLKQVN